MPLRNTTKARSPDPPKRKPEIHLKTFFASAVKTALTGHKHMKSICVYCGSSAGIRPEYKNAALALAKALSERGMGLVYGGGDVGLMGIVARESLRLGCGVEGVITKDLFKREVAFKELPTLHVVESMHERKALMAKLADGFIAMPGGLGTFDEFFEAITWTQLGIHLKPCGLLNTCGYYTPLISFLEHAVKEGFICTGSLSALHSSSEPGELLDFMAKFKPGQMPDKAKAALAIELGSRKG